MKIFFAGFEGKFYKKTYPDLVNLVLNSQTNILASYFTLRKRNNDFSEALPYFKDFLLDSGAFSFISGAKNVNWDSYIEEYADYIKRNNIQKFFELDIDSVIGYKKVKEYRKKLERLTNRQCIPVFHRTRGLDEFFRLCDEYNYISLGGIAIRHIRPDEYKYFLFFINEAHKRHCKIHGLGFTQINKLNIYHFDSVDSTTWLSGGRFGHIHKFYNGKILQKSAPKMNMRVINSKKLDVHNLSEWIKFQKYAEVHL